MFDLSLSGNLGSILRKSTSGLAETAGKTLNFVIGKRLFIVDCLDEAHHGLIAILSKALKSFGTQPHKIVERLRISGLLLDNRVRDGFVLEVGHESLAIA